MPLTALEHSESLDHDQHRKTLAYVVHSMNVGGAERSIARLINALDHTRFRPIVVCLAHTGPAADWIESPDVPVFEIHQSSTFDRQALRRLSQLLIEQKVDLVHSHNWGTLIESTLACRKAAVTAHVHAERGTVLGNVEMRGWRMQLRRICAAWAMRCCYAVVTNAHSVARRVQERCNYPMQKVRVIPNGIENHTSAMTEHERDSKRSELGIAPDAVIIGSVGRLVPVKGFDLAVQAIAQLATAGHNCHLLLVGEGPLKESLASLAKSLGIQNRIHLVGHQITPARWYELIDIYVNTSHSEGMSQSLVEAMAAKRPVIATNVGDSAVVIGEDTSCGHVVEAGNVPQLVDAIRQSLPLEERKRLGHRAGERYSREFTLSKMAGRYTDLYDAALKNTSTTTHREASQGATT